METFKKEFINFAITKNVLRFGEFKLKSGRISPYFFNSGLFNDGESLARLGRFYAQAVMASRVEFDMLFGPAYKGIPLASAMAISLSCDYDRAVPYCFNRKEVKDHGEGGILLGAPLAGRVLIIDDVITAGTSVRESVKLIEHANASTAAVVIALDRQERGEAELSAIQEIEAGYGIPVISIICLEDLVDYLGHSTDLLQHLEKIQEYRQTYGVIQAQ